MGPAAQAVVIAAASILAGLASQSVRERPLPWRQSWSNAVLEKAAAEGLAVVEVRRARTLLDAGSVLALDARPHADYLAGHLPGSMPLPSTAVGEFLPQVLPLLTPEQPLLVYCSGLSCDESIQLALTLRQQGFTNLLLFAGGMKEWQSAGLALER